MAPAILSLGPCPAKETFLDLPHFLAPQRRGSPQPGILRRFASEMRPRPLAGAGLPRRGVPKCGAARRNPDAAVSRRSLARRRGGRRRTPSPRPAMLPQKGAESCARPRRPDLRLLLRPGAVTRTRGGEPSGPLRKASRSRCAAKQASRPWPEVANAGDQRAGDALADGIASGRRRRRPARRRASERRETAARAPRRAARHSRSPTPWLEQGSEPPRPARAARRSRSGKDGPETEMRPSALSFCLRGCKAFAMFKASVHQPCFPS